MSCPFAWIFPNKSLALRTFSSFENKYSDGAIICTYTINPLPVWSSILSKNSLIPHIWDSFSYELTFYTITQANNITMHVPCGLLHTPKTENRSYCKCHQMDWCIHLKHYHGMAWDLLNISMHNQVHATVSINLIVLDMAPVR